MLRALAVRVAARRGSIIAATAGASAATAAAAAYCDSAKAKTPPFVLDGDRYDQTTFAGRLAKIQELIDMRTLLTTDDELAAAQARLGEFKKLGRKPDGVSDEDMWEAQKTVNAIIHGPTGEKMFLFGRMSMFVPMNVPVAFGLLVSKSTAAVLFWQYAQRARTPETHEPETACRARARTRSPRAPPSARAPRARVGAWALGGPLRISSMRVKPTLQVPAVITARYGTNGPSACRLGTALSRRPAPIAIEHAEATASAYDCASGIKSTVGPARLT